MKTLTFAPGDVIFWQGDFSASMFDIISGKVGIYIGYETDQEKTEWSTVEDWLEELKECLERHKEVKEALKTILPTYHKT